MPIPIPPNVNAAPNATVPATRADFIMSGTIQLMMWPRVPIGFIGV
jgi:hypothetical protein